MIQRIKELIVGRAATGPLLSEIQQGVHSIYPDKTLSINQWYNYIHRKAKIQTIR